MKKVYLGMDVQTTGRLISRHAMIHLACVIVDENAKVLDKFQVALKMPPGSIWEEEWMNVFWSKHTNVLQTINDTAVDVKEAMALFVLWIDDMDMRYKQNLVLLSGKTHVDVSWINLYLSCFTYRPALHYAYSTEHKGYAWRPILDMYSIWYGVMLEKSKKEGSNSFSLTGKPWWFTDNGDVLHGARAVAVNYVYFVSSLAIE